MPCKSGGYQPAVVDKPRRQVQCAAFPHCEFARRMHSTGGLRPPLLVARADALADGRFSPTRAILFPRGGLRPPMLTLVQRPSTGRTTIFAMHERTFDQERRASARGGLVKPTLRGENVHCYTTTRRTCKSGGRQPAVVSKRIRSGRRFPPNGTRASHGWSTPAALGWACGSCCRWRFVSGVALVFARLVYVSRCWKFVWRL